MGKPRFTEEFKIDAIKQITGRDCKLQVLVGH